VYIRPAQQLSTLALLAAVAFILGPIFARAQPANTDMFCDFEKAKKLDEPQIRNKHLESRRNQFKEALKSVIRTPEPEVVVASCDDVDGWRVDRVETQSRSWVTKVYVTEDYLRNFEPQP
jgi:hypothetical protein